MPRPAQPIAPGPVGAGTRQARRSCPPLRATLSRTANSAATSRGTYRMRLWPIPAYLRRVVLPLGASRGSGSGSGRGPRSCRPPGPARVSLPHPALRSRPPGPGAARGTSRRRLHPSPPPERGSDSGRATGPRRAGKANVESTNRRIVDCLTTSDTCPACFWSTWDRAARSWSASQVAGSNPRRSARNCSIDASTSGGSAIAARYSAADSLVASATSSQPPSTSASPQIASGSIAAAVAATCARTRGLPSRLPGRRPLDPSRSRSGR